MAKAELVLVVAALVLGALVAAITARLVYGAHTEGLFWVARFGRHDDLVRVPCTECDGYGIRYYSGGKMRNITVETRDRKRGVWSWGQPLGNKLTCLKCKGHGFNWVAKNAANTHPYQR